MIRYDALVLLANEGDFSEAWLEVFLTAFVNNRAKFMTIKPSARRLVTVDEGAYRMTSIYSLMWDDGWRMHFYLRDDPTIAIESTEMAERCAKDHPDRAIIATCRRRVEIHSDDDDMNHFNDFVIIQEAFCKVPQAYVWEAAGGTFQN